MNDHFNRSLKREYSWLPRGITSSIINNFAQGSWSMISAILSNGEFIWLIINGSGTSENFWQFLSIINYAIKSTMKDSERRFLYVMDNASIHHSNLTISKMKDLNLSIMFLPAYSPELAPVENFFRLTKNKIRGAMVNIEYSLNTPEERIIIFEWIKNTTKKSIIKMWIEFIEKAKQWILKLY